MTVTGRIYDPIQLVLILLVLFTTVSYASEVTYRNAIASAHPLATDAGMEILSEGGNAFDAAITVAAVLAVVEPYAAGIGGGGFWLLHRASDNKRVMVDGRERAPLDASRDMYLDAEGKVIPGLSLNGALSAAIPGQVAAMTHIHRHYGSLSLQRLLAPAIRYAEQGFAVDRVYRKLVNVRLGVLQRFPSSASIFLSDGEVPAEGTVIKQPELAETFRRIAHQGRDGFYRGETAEQLVDGVRAAGGIWSLEDLARYQVIERQPVTMEWKNLRITLASLPSSGGIVIAQILNMLHELGWSERNESQRMHLLVEAMRRAYRDRAQYLGDSDYVSVNVGRLTSPQHARQLVQDLEPDQATPSEFLAPVSVRLEEGSDTNHYSILDKDGNKVAATTSINYPFGSGFVVPETGVLLNDEMDDFSIRPGTPNAYGLVGNEANAIAPGKRMLSSMSPAFVESPERMAIVGTPGGSRIITMVLQAIIGFYEGKSAREIVGMPRFHHQYLPDYIQLEPGAIDGEIRRRLEAMGHNLKQLESSYGNMQVVVHDFAQSITSAASDPRGIGAASVK